MMSVEQSVELKVAGKRKELCNAGHMTSGCVISTGCDAICRKHCIFQYATCSSCNPKGKHSDDGLTSHSYTSPLTVNLKLGPLQLLQ
jgi:hypothetical protein